MTQYAAQAKTNLLALVGFIAAFVIPLAGVILSIFARRQLDAPGNTESGRGLARWAMVIGILGTLAQVAFFILWFSLFFRAVA
ncbi:MAG: DUF4190 domain-containing protein [Microbacterium sp.]|uniref:hypothetical protein n=1 Tax=Microbacterium TaxID=33882 RepID=UPI0006F334BD|nr:MULTISPECIES: hypothetical protein [unclassified Microbacterium]KRD51634.1 hypothetical protein ASE34_06695 [Microbacterium sp. Root280D1]CAH0169335.1 hypothetical protein SRABI98_01231 [Microbacterium sp. Bi98]